MSASEGSVQSTSAGPCPNIAPPYLPVLTGVRAVAAYLVYLHHFNPFREVPGLEGIFANLVREFHVGVPIFFVLSGFLITLRYVDSGSWTRPAWARYLRNRVARIYPLYFLLTALAFVGIWHQTGGFSLGSWLLNVTFLRGFFEEYVYSGIAQGWTLTVEECFYLAAPLIFLVLRRRPRALWLLPALLLGAGVGLVGLGQLLPFHSLFGNLRFMLLFTFFGRATEFFVGIQLAPLVPPGAARRWPRGLAHGGGGPGYSGGSTGAVPDSRALQLRAGASGGYFPQQRGAAGGHCGLVRGPANGTHAHPPSAQQPARPGAGAKAPMYST